MAVTLNDKYLKGVVNADELKGMEPMVKVAHEMIENKNGLGNDFLGWVDLPVNYDKEEFERIKKAAAKIKADSEVLIVILSCYIPHRSQPPAIRWMCSRQVFQRLGGQTSCLWLHRANASRWQKYG